MVLLYILPGSPVCNRICQSYARKRQHLPVKKRNNRSTTRFCEDYRFTLVTYIGIIEVDAVGRSKRKVRLQMANCTDRIKKLKKIIMAQYQNDTNFQNQVIADTLEKANVKIKDNSFASILSQYATSSSSSSSKSSSSSDSSSESSSSESESSSSEATSASEEASTTESSSNE